MKINLPLMELLSEVDSDLLCDLALVIIEELNDDELLWLEEEVVNNLIERKDNKEEANEKH